MYAASEVLPSEPCSLANGEAAAAAHGEEAAAQEVKSVGDGDPLERYYKLVGSAGE